MFWLAISFHIVELQFAKKSRFCALLDTRMKLPVLTPYTIRIWFLPGGKNLIRSILIIRPIVLYDQTCHLGVIRDIPHAMLWNVHAHFFKNSLYDKRIFSSERRAHFFLIILKYLMNINKNLTEILVKIFRSAEHEKIDHLE